MERLYRYVKSHRWASNLGAAVLSGFESLWAHAVGLLKRGRRPPVESIRTAVLADLVSNGMVDLHLPFEEHTVVNSAPVSIYETDPPMFEMYTSQVIQPGFLASVSNGYVWRDGAVFLPDGTLIEESMRAPSLHPLVEGARLPRAVRFEGSLGVLSSTYGRGFYHWVFNSLARLAIMEAADLKPDAYVVNFKHLRFQQEWLQALGVEPVYSSIELPFVQPDTTFVTQLPGRDGIIPSYAVEFLRRKLHAQRGGSSDGPTRVFVSRARAAKRRLGIDDALDSVLSKYGFTTVALETIPLAERAGLLSNAEIYLCPDGAGMSNMLFCDNGVKVIELLTHRTDKPFGWSLSNRLGFDYHYVQGKEEQPGIIQPDELAATIELALSGDN